MAGAHNQTSRLTGSADLIDTDVLIEPLQTPRLKVGHGQQSGRAWSMFCLFVSFDST